ncbi:hypothetical protein [Thalassoglobus polymorphus]|uniref:Uncharacterized protein n=1 Tax=Thalassoglobus polymorphus TaxID=2527994 RepID=A0A517QHC7_9PLAN|nr:hypothetical protein [Thalassoglobus polymorphus]QDT30912.1 hypothetical protein Mal48_01410 [Thalassoglobus polymorphus]QDT30957.1 hypothetical protein Mal48_01860 [Thalassoglobus polymorphus]
MNCNQRTTYGIMSSPASSCRKYGWWPGTIVTADPLQAGDCPPLLRILDVGTMRVTVEVVQVGDLQTKRPREVAETSQPGVFEWFHRMRNWQVSEHSPSKHLILKKAAARELLDEWFRAATEGRDDNAEAISQGLRELLASK